MGYTDVEDGLGSLEDVFTVIEDQFAVSVIDGEDLREDYNTMYDNCAISTCCSTMDISGDLHDFDRYLGWYEDDTTGIVSNAGDVLDYMAGYGSYGLLFTLLISLFLVLSMFFYLLFAFMKSNGGLGCACCCGNTTFIIVMILGALFMMATATVGDVCHDDPTYAICDQVPPGKGQIYLVWYSTCGETGANPLLAYTDAIEGEANDILAAIEIAETNNAACITEPELQAVKQAAEDALVTLDDAVEHAYCEDIQQAWFDSVNDGVCGNFFTGLRTCWIVALLSTLMLFVLQIPSAVVRRACSNRAQVAPKNDPAPAPDAQPIAYPQQGVMMVPMMPPADQGGAGGDLQK